MVIKFILQPWIVIQISKFWDLVTCFARPLSRGYDDVIMRLNMALVYLNISWKTNFRLQKYFAGKNLSHLPKIRQNVNIACQGLIKFLWDLMSLALHRILFPTILSFCIRPCCRQFFVFSNLYILACLKNELTVHIIIKNGPRFYLDFSTHFWYRDRTRERRERDTPKAYENAHGGGGVVLQKVYVHISFFSGCVKTIICCNLSI